MKRKILLINLFFAMFPCLILPQNGGLELEMMQQKFKNFQYSEVVVLAEKALSTKASISEQNLIKIYEMKAIAHYSLMDMTASLNSFLELLKMDDNYSLDPVQTSPKIIHFFNEIKSNLQQKVEQPVAPIPVVKPDTVRIFIDKTGPIKGSLTRSLLLPGWGHLHSASKTKGLFLGTASVLTLGSGLYYIFDCKDKEKCYLNETDKALMDSKYKNYNTSYKIRNTLILSYTAIWLYSQVDLLVFHKHQPTENRTTYIQPSLTHDGTPVLSCKIKF